MYRYPVISNFLFKHTRNGTSIRQLSLRLDNLLLSKNALDKISEPAGYLTTLSSGRIVDFKPGGQIIWPNIQCIRMYSTGILFLRIVVRKAAPESDQQNNQSLIIGPDTNYWCKDEGVLTESSGQTGGW
jgi:hypothetical protein